MHMDKMLLGVLHASIAMNENSLHASNLKGIPALVRASWQRFIKQDDSPQNLDDSPKNLDDSPKNLDDGSKDDKKTIPRLEEP